MLTSSFWKSVIVLLLLIISSNTYSHATGSKTIERGTAPTINWNVGGSATQCNGSTIYPAPSALSSAWNNSVRSSAGSASLPAAMTTGSYPFTCTDLGSGVDDTATLIVEDCGGSLSAGRGTWNGSACVAAAAQVYGACGTAADTCSPGTATHGVRSFNITFQLEF